MVYILFRTGLQISEFYGLTLWDVAEYFRSIIEDDEQPRFEKVIDRYSGSLFVDKDCNSLVTLRWEHRFNRMVNRYNEIY